MRVQLRHLTAVLNRLYETGETTISVEHPAEEIGELLRIKLRGYDDSAVVFTTTLDDYSNATTEIELAHGDRVANDLPDSADFRNTLMGAGILPPGNHDELQTFLNRYGDPDLMAGHPPVFAGFDTNLLPWRIERVLGLREPDTGLGYVNGFVLATGVRDELTWENKCHDTDPSVDAFGPEFEEYWNQSVGAARIGRLGLLTYRNIRDIQQAVEVESGRGDGEIIDAYDGYNQEWRSDTILLSNDKNFVERARTHRMLGQRVEFPREFPDEVAADWDEIGQLLYLLAIVFGIIKLPGVTIYGVWRGKDQLDWQYERLKIDARSPKIGDRLEADLSIVESYEELESTLP